VTENIFVIKFVTIYSYDVSYIVIKIVTNTMLEYVMMVLMTEVKFSSLQ
jgi:hypothetical protein